MSDPRIEILIASFYHDPLAEFFWPNDEFRAKQLTAGLEFLLKLSSIILSSETANRKCVGVIGAVRPGRYPPPFFHSMVALIRLTLKLLPLTPLSEMIKMPRVFHRFDKIHPRQPHWYIGVLGVHPDQQGKGLGGELLKPILQKAEEESVIVYLECSNPNSLDFYRKYGFNVIEEIVPVRGCPPIWGLVRKPMSESSELA
ncbi:MAG: GNAT family N-acetyltransferase [Desulfomonilaceae bacterium]